MANHESEYPIGGGTTTRPVTTRADRRRFVAYPYDRYRRDPHWIPPLRIAEHQRLSPTRNPFFAHAEVELFLAWRKSRVVGRIAAIDDRLHQETHGDNVGMFGFFEAEDREASTALLGAAEAWTRARGRALLRGPISPSQNDTTGLLVDGFDTDPMLMMPHNPPEYATFIESAGYGKVKDLYAWLYQITPETVPIITTLATRVRNRHGVTVGPLALSAFEQQIESMREIYCGAWKHNWGFVPPTPDEFRHIANELKPIFDERCAVCAKIDGRPVAFAIALPDVNQVFKGTDGRLFPRGLVRFLRRRQIIDQVRLLLLGVMAEYRSLGLYPLLLSELHKQVAGTAYRRAEFSWVLEDNRDINQPAELAGAIRYKTYRVYQKALGG
jgi:hypothetical protein